MNDKPQHLTYKDAGVDIEAGQRLVENIKSIASQTHRPGVMGGLGGFGALFEIPLERYKKPVLVSSTDGVGTKLKLAQTLSKHNTIGIDLVAMCVNDIIVQGAEPLFFLDYFATGHLNAAAATEIIAGIGEGCRQAGAALVGGETAEMPGMYVGDDYDLAGFSVGIVEKDKIIDGSKVAAGDVLIGLGASGPHSNGYSLIRKILEKTKADLTQLFSEHTLGEALLAPTCIYVKSLLALINVVDIHAMAHITGGGLTDNLPRVLPPGVKAVVHTDSWTRPAIFDWLQEKGHIADAEMYRTFNCGIGMVICVREQDVDASLEILKKCGENAFIIGSIETAAKNETPILID